MLGGRGVGAAGVWLLVMIALSTVLVSVVICFTVGVPMGILSAYRKLADTILKPILDTMQTKPVFVYLSSDDMFFLGGQDCADI